MAMSWEQLNALALAGRARTANNILQIVRGIRADFSDTGDYGEWQASMRKEMELNDE